MWHEGSLQDLVVVYEAWPGDVLHGQEGMRVAIGLESKRKKEDGPLWHCLTG